MPDSTSTSAVEALRAVVLIHDEGATKAVAKKLGLEDEAGMSIRWPSIVWDRARQALAALEQGAGEEVDPAELPRCDKLDGSTLLIVPSYTEAGRFCEANCLTITDGERTAIYVPSRALEQGEAKSPRKRCGGEDEDDPGVDTSGFAERYRAPIPAPEASWTDTNRQLVEQARQHIANCWTAQGWRAEQSLHGGYEVWTMDATGQHRIVLARGLTPNAAALMCFVSSALPQLCDLAERLASLNATPASQSDNQENRS